MAPKIPKTAAEILASAQPAPQAPQPPKKPRKPQKPRERNPFSSNENLTRFLGNLSSSVASTSSSTLDTPALSISPQTFKFMTPYAPKAQDDTSAAGGMVVDNSEEDDCVGMGGMGEETRLSDSEPFYMQTDISEGTPSSPKEDKRPRIPRTEHIDEVLQTLRAYRLSPFDLILDVLDNSNTAHSSYRKELYKADNKKLGQILEHIQSHPAGRTKLDNLILPYALDTICKQVNIEMDAIKEAEKLSGLHEITPDFIKNWKVSGHQGIAPTLFQILLAAAESISAKDKNKKKKPDSTCNIIMKQLAFQRSHNSLGFPGVFGLFLWTTGCARQTIEALHRCGLSVSYTSVLKIVESLADHCMKLAVEAASGIHAFGYDNINLSTSIFVEQRGHFTPAKVTSGTFGVVYKLRNAKPEHMKLAPMLERLKIAPGLDFNRDFRPTRVQMESFEAQLLVIIVTVLATYCQEFQPYVNHPLLQHKPRRPIPEGYKTEQFPTRVTSIEEATTEGNLRFHEDVYLNQLRRNPEQLSEYAIPTYNDQLTNSRIRSAQTIRARDINPWTRRQVFQLGLSLFHLCLNLVWLLLHIHRGSLEQTGSLTYFFALLEKTRLGGDHPDYHSLLAALIQILHGLLLNAWRCECGFRSLGDFAASKPSPEQLLAISRTILRNHATPMATLDTSEIESDPGSDTDSVDSNGEGNSNRQHRQTAESTSSSHSQAPPSTPHITNPGDDIVHQNIRLLTHDLLYVAELIQAISDGDIGRVEDFLPQLAMIFRGAGGNNYCTEILHFIFNLRHVWTPEFANIMRDNMLVNFTGLKGHSMPIDLNIEHLIGELKALLEAKGLKSTWDRLGNISAAIDYLKKVKKTVSTSMNSSYQSTTHTKPDTSHLVWRVADTAGTEVFEKFIRNRPGNSRMVANISALRLGERKVKSSTIATFNKKTMAMRDGQLYPSELDTDTIPMPAYGNMETTDDRSEV